MHILTFTNSDKLRIVRSSAATLDVVTSWADNASGTITEGSEVHAFNTASNDDILATPGSGKNRKVKEMTVRNKDTISCDVTIQYQSSATNYELIKVTLNPGDTLEYTEATGFFVVTGASLFEFTGYTNADQVLSATGFTTATGLSCAVKSGKKYAFMAWLMHISGATTTGFQAGVNGPANNNVQLATIDTVTASVTASAHSAGAAAALNTAATAQTTGSAAIVGGLLAGGIEPSADGTFAITWQPEVAATCTLKRGSWMKVWETNN